MSVWAQRAVLARWRSRRSEAAMTSSGALLLIAGAATASPWGSVFVI